MKLLPDALERRVLPRVVEDGLVHHLDRGGLVAQDHRRGGERFEQVGELDHQHGLGLRQRHQIQLGFQHDAERAFRADHHLRQVERALRVA